MLNRILTVTSGGLDFQSDHWHSEILMKDTGVDEGSKGATTPGSNSEGGHGEAQGDRGERRYSAVAARGNFLGQGRMDIQFAAKEVSRFMCRRSKTGERRRD